MYGLSIKVLRRSPKPKKWVHYLQPVPLTNYKKYATFIVVLYIKVLSSFQPGVWDYHYNFGCSGSTLKELSFTKFVDEVSNPIYPLFKAPSNLPSARGFNLERVYLTECKICAILPI